jgi:dipeptidyl-peptidase-3
MGLKYYHIESDKWGQAHMQARYVILQVCLEAGNGLIEIVEDESCEDKVYIKLDREKIKEVGVPALGRFLKQLQIYKSTANAEEGREYFKTYSRVNENMLRLRNKIISTSKPRPLMVQCNLYMENNNVKLKNYEPSYKGLIESFIDRYEKDEYKDVEMYDFLTN